MVEKESYIGGWNEPIKEKHKIKEMHIEDMFPTNFGRKDKNGKRNRL